ncbi:MAG: ATP-dependent RNA helicase RhlE, partial [Shewanella sp.]
RELAVQVAANIAQYGKHLDLTSMAMYGGVDAEPQRQRLLEGVDILVATPGRLLDMYTQRAIHFDELEILVLDEADRMLDMGFIEDIDKIMDKLPTDRQSLLFSATLSHQVKALAKTTVDNPVEISVIANTDSKPKIEQWLITVDKDKKSALLSHLIKENDWQQALIFIETKQGAAKLVSQLDKRGITAECIHGGRSQEVREKILADFKAGNIGLLVATGVAARGLDIDELPLVINYDLPYPADDYIHRIGRTGRAGANGKAVSLVSRDDFKNLCMIESRLGQLIERREIEGFTPLKEVPTSVLNFKPKFKKMTEKSKDTTKREPKRSANTAADKKRTGQQDSKSKASNDANKLPLNPWNT